ncbi:MAG: chromosomal replication initiator protein DnaA [Candidatus Zambryskibacteria bacterium RIFCSPLOWO2_01_FULL_39_39]|uniref:Chromosomal replication initiator protein DnaA n=1 Tax=Candidatus Zambryskibacteria bacterium RIFCSPLOWO2_01_FULL_39_39 TaxID=1802758 RepID=A0A1G2TWF0_9BACT|nr:MAG: chromosomal replication initiator protein DnaA [Candidatus Zambryskibacteria bacterium RIFCSPHIGHO2_01_FULL_39_63]OHA94419.1 MAG: chromosomal replication initiator protein DnaA [Candidatus Zambryskibacteria bacterium RIFCSPHIGHO2_02_FULL_39_19]OHA98769.1 MAG: chromosomal replication initiator protein DnaA [Candidatus Zambryskibacteria bacterium RIFCSPHIGHO2_12_FULL_39_21]OHB01627.1 MAG: chromosomal replication initiator protein DnaA [Candidatus Zambryskibacteria bacterium RIFCSPLOWO2_01_
MDTKELWNNVLLEIEISVSKANFATWFKETKISGFENGIIYLSVPNTFVQEWLMKKFHNLVLKLLRQSSESIHTLEYVIKEESKAKNQYIPTKTSSPTKELPLSEYYINKDDNLNPRYTFESFVVGPFNELAYAAAQAVIKNLGITYNPYFIFGNTGHGKTHLIQAMGNAVKAIDPSKKIYYFTSEKFFNDYVSSVQANKVNQFKEKYRKYDMLIMDDIQFLSGKEKTQEELFHIFNSMKDENKHIVFSCDKHPNFVTGLEDRLKSRFAAGMVIDIPAPDHESRLAIIKSKCSSINLFIDEVVMDYLADSIKGNIRDLEGVINLIVCQTETKNKILTLNEVKDLVKNSIKQKKLMSYKEVVKIISDFYKIEEETIYEKTRKKEVIKPRQIIMYILREDFSISYPSIGEKLGGRDHTTVIHSYEKIKNEIRSDTLLLKEIQEIRSIIG